MKNRLKNEYLMTALALALVFLLTAPAQSASDRHRTKTPSLSNLEDSVSKLETDILHEQYNNEVIIFRILRLEKEVFGSIQLGSLEQRVDKLAEYDSEHAAKGAQPSGANETPSSETSSENGNVQSPRQQPKPRTLEQLSWDASAAIDAILTAEDNADSVSLNDAAARLYDMSTPDSAVDSDKVQSAASYHERGLTALNRGKFSEALSNLKQAQTLNPLEADILNDLVKALIKTNDLQTAIIYAPVAISVQPSSTNGWCNMAEIFARAKQYQRARNCVFIAYLISDDADKSLTSIQERLNNIDESEVKTPFKQALFMVQATLKDFNNSRSDSDQFSGPEADIGLYKANALVSLATPLQQIKPNSNIVLTVTISQNGNVLETELLRSSGDPNLDKKATKTVAEIKLPPLPKSYLAEKKQFIVPLNKIVLALAD